MTKKDHAVPDLLYTAKVIDAHKWTYLEDLDPRFVEQFRIRAAEKAVIVPVTQRFLLNIQNMLGDFRFHLIGVPQTFVDEQLPGLILAGRLPKPGETGLVAGSTAARMWDLSVGDHFTTTLANNYATNQINCTLTGILDPNTHNYFDRAMFFGFGTYQKQSGEAANPNLMGYRAPPAMDIDECFFIEFATWTILW